MTSQDLIRLFNMIDVDYPNNPIARSPEEKKLFATRWMQRLGDYETMSVYAAYEMHLARSPKFAPGWQDIVRIISEISSGAVESADEAWAKVMKSMHLYGWWKTAESIAFIGERAWAAVQVVGWESLNTMTMEQKPFIFAQFRDAYNNRIRREAEQAMLPKSVANLISQFGNSTRPIESGEARK